KAKRPAMGKAAATHADRILLTSDNPRDEDPLAIIADIQPGLAGGRAAVLVEPDRRRAIARALREARTGDIVLVAGKGHETWQQLRDTRVPFEDPRVVLEELA
ncbi:MAG: UDP-N-acetylmuramoyl-L-alanyl-D-glutamate--2,6-diaminopimelate ligase, partial [Planctomycetota bacterium]